MFSQVSRQSVLGWGVGVSSTRSLLRRGGGMYSQGVGILRGGRYNWEGRVSISRGVGIPTPYRTDIYWWPLKHVRLASGQYASYCNDVLFHHISTDTFLPAIVSTTDLQAILMSKLYCCVMENITASMVHCFSLQ